MSATTKKDRLLLKGLALTSIATIDDGVIGILSMMVFAILLVTIILKMKL